MNEINSILADLKEMSNLEYVSKMEYFGIKPGTSALGITNAILKPYAKSLGHDQNLANQLWDQPIHECKHLAILVSEPTIITKKTLEKWTSECYSWDLVDGIGMKILPKTSFAFEKVFEWSERNAEYEKRMSFATMVGLSLKGANQPDEKIQQFFPVIEREAWDERNFVKKAVNWALRQIGKRNLIMNAKAIQVAEHIKLQETKSAKWIAADALRELKSDKVRQRLL